MANFLCDNPCVTCPGSFDDNPFANLTAEGPDIDRFIGHQYPTGNPPLGSTWYTIGCDGWCFSNVSQDDADLCALRAAVDCQSVNWPVLVPNPNTNPDVVHNFPDIPQARELFYNQEQSASAACPNGDPTSFVCPAGTFNAFSQSEADAEALSYARNQSVANYICLGPLTRTQICSGLYYNGTVAVTSSTTPLTYSVTGNLPDGVFLVSTANGFGLQGLPTTPGNYTFTVTAVNPGGTTKSQEYTISVTGITNSPVLTPAVSHHPYMVQLDLEGIILNSIFEFTITTGALPAGLTLNAATGIISGTPTVAAVGTSTFTVTTSFFFNGDLIATCSSDFTIVTTDPAGVFWDIVWAPPTVTTVGSGSGSVSAANNSGSGQSSVGAYTVGPANQGIYHIVGDLTITPTSDIHGFITSNTSASVDDAQARALITVKLNAITVYQRSSFSGTGSVGTGAFTLLAGVPYVVRFTMDFFCVSQAGPSPNPDAKNCLGDFLVIQTP